MQAFDRIVRAMQIEAYNKKLLAEQLGSYLFNLIISFEIICIGFMINTGAQCLEYPFTIDYQITNTTSTDHINAGNYLNIVCSTQIKMRAIGFYLLRVGFLVYTGMFLAFSKWQMRAINKYENIVVGHKLEKFVGKNAVDVDRDYQLDLAEKAMTFLKVKGVFLIFFTLTVIGMLCYTFLDPDIREVYFPDSFKCVTDGEFTTFADDFYEYRCHFDEEFLIFVVAVTSDMFKVMLLVILWISLFLLVKYISILDTLPQQASRFRSATTHELEKSDSDDFTNTPHTPGTPASVELQSTHQSYGSQPSV